MASDAEAAVAAYRMAAALNLMRVTVDEPTVRFGLALHIGEVMFGNIGANARLDFTVIGPAVNHTARLEKLCSELDRPIVVSSALAALLPEREVVPLGRHLKGHRRAAARLRPQQCLGGLTPPVPGACRDGVLHDPPRQSRVTRDTIISRAGSHVCSGRAARAGS